MDAPLPSRPQLAQVPHILVVDDDIRLRELLRRYLADHEFLVTTAAHAGEARQMLDVLAFDLMILDIMMPGESGLELAQHLRRGSASGGGQGRSLPILLLTARGEAEDRIAGLEAGADDYLPKPFEPRELLLRINAILRRITPPPGRDALPEISLGKWRFDSARDELRAGDDFVRLTEMEAKLLRILAAEPGVAISREQLAVRSKSEINDRTIDVQITRLRRKIEADAKAPRYIVTVRGAGYMLLPDGEPL
ncbi:MAG: response regulator transcription factor [Alphaproteobacteria bacterium]